MTALGTWERPVDVEVVVTCRLRLRKMIAAHDYLVDAINEIELYPLWKELGGDDYVPWGNLQHIYRDELTRRFGSDGCSDSPMIEI